MAYDKDVFVQIKSALGSFKFKNPFRQEKLSKLLSDLLPNIRFSTITATDGDFAGNVQIDGTLNVDGAITANGSTITLGDTAGDSVVFSADVDSNILPDDTATYTLGSAAKGWKSTFLAKTAADVALTVDADTIDATSDVIDIDLGVNSASVNAIDISADVKTALSAGEIVRSVNIDTNALAADADTSAVIGLDITASTVATSRADIKGVRVITDGAMSTADTVYGLEARINSDTTAGVEMAGVFVDSNSTLNNAAAEFHGVLVDVRDVINTSSNEITGFKVLLEDDGKGLVVDAATVDHAAGNLIEVNGEIKDVAAGAATGIDINMTETVAGTNGTSIYGSDVAVVGFATGRADLIGSRVVLSGSKTGGDSTIGFKLDADSLTLNNAAEDFIGIHVDASGLTNTNSDELVGVKIEVPATADSAIQANGLINSTKNVGVVGAGTVSAVETGDGRDFTTTLTLTNFVVGAVPGGAALAVGNIIYEFPAAGMHVVKACAANIGFTIVGTGQTPVYALGSVVGSGAVATLAGTATFFDYQAAQYTAADTAGTATKEGPFVATVGALAGIALNKTGDEKSLFLNSAETWAGDNAGDLTASGTITIHWTRMD